MIEYLQIGFVLGSILVILAIIGLFFKKSREIIINIPILGDSLSDVIEVLESIKNPGYETEENLESILLVSLFINIVINIAFIFAVTIFYGLFIPIYILYLIIKLRIKSKE